MLKAETNKWVLRADLNSDKVEAILIWVGRLEIGSGERKKERKKERISLRNMENMAYMADYWR